MTGQSEALVEANGGSCSGPYLIQSLRTLWGPWLSYAIYHGRLAVAHELLDLDANCNTISADLNEQTGDGWTRKGPLMLVMTKGQKDISADYLPLIKKLLARGAEVHMGHLKQSIMAEGAAAEALFVALVKEGRYGPTSLADANTLMALAQEHNHPRIVYILQEMTTMLRHDNTSWGRSAKAQNKSVVVANARARVLRDVRS